MSNVEMDPHMESLEHIKNILKTLMSTNDYMNARIDDISAEIKAMSKRITNLQKLALAEEDIQKLSAEYHKEEAAWALSDADD